MRQQKQKRLDDLRHRPLLRKLKTLRHSANRFEQSQLFVVIHLYPEHVDVTITRVLSLYLPLCPLILVISLCTKSTLPPCI